MTTKIIMPVIDTERGKFEYKGRKLTREEFGDIEYDHFLKTNRQVGQFVENMRRGISNFSGRMKDVKDGNHPDIFYNLEEIECMIFDSRKNNVPSGFFKQYIESGRMFIIRINFNPESMSCDAKSEMRFWINDSDKVLRDNEITDDLKLKTLSTRFFWVRDGEEVILLNGCKIVQIYTGKDKDKNPFYLGIIVEKATYDNGN